MRSILGPLILETPYRASGRKDAEMNDLSKRSRCNRGGGACLKQGAVCCWNLETSGSEYPVFWIPIKSPVSKGGFLIRFLHYKRLRGAVRRDNVHLGAVPE